MRWAQGGGGCVRSCRPARHWRGGGTGFHAPAAASADERWRQQRWWRLTPTRLDAAVHLDANPAG